MSEREIIVNQEERGVIDGHAMQQMFGKMMGLMQNLADSQRVTNERITALEKQNALAARVTPAQARELGRLMRERASSLAADYFVNQDPAKSISNAIRRGLMLNYGVQSMRDLPKCEYSVYVAWISAWEDYGVLKGMGGLV